MVERVTFTFEDNGGFHNDLVLRIGEAVWRADSYFLWNEDPRGGAGAEVVRCVLSTLIKQWISAIRNLEPGQACFLPFDFSDEFTKWMHCRLDGDQVLIRVGSSRIEGWSFLPSDVGGLINHVPDFTPDDFAATIAREAMIRSLDTSKAV